ncbi:MAG: 30S ribosomal protein S6 [Anaerolineaceae bacterium]|nr:30S ribosomal protein S6 [Anaerolineaceae bacterium]
MRKYEVIFIAHPDLDEENLNAIVEKVKGWIAEDKGEVVSVDNWGKKRMAYRIRKQRDGQYVLITANMEPASVKNLSQNMRYVESIMRSMITIVDED